MYQKSDERIKMFKRLGKEIKTKKIDKQTERKQN